MKKIRLYTLVALLLMAGGVTMQAQTEDDFWMDINPPTTGIFSLIEDAEGNIIVGATGVCKWQIKNQQFFVINFHQFFVISFHQFWIVLRKSAVEAEAA